MAKTEVIAAAFKISPPTLQKWLDGDKPTRGKYLSICQEIFAKFDYVDGEWLSKEATPDQTSSKQAETVQAENATSIDSEAKPDIAEAVEDTPDRTEASDPQTEATEVTEKEKKKEQKEKKEEDDDSASEPSAMFSAVGIIVGEINIDEESGNHTISLGNKTYPLFYARKNYTAFTGLKKEIATTGNKTQRLIVYPKFTHFPKKHQPPRVGFQLVGFDKGREPNGVASELKELEFKLCGLWQFIPVCRQPCISIFRNFTFDRLDYIKQAEAQSKVNFMKASHLPILWKDSPAPPFRFNPKAAKEEQGKTFFVQVKAVFLPHRDCFGFVEQLAEPTEKPPKFLKASKKDKAAVQKSKPKTSRPVDRDMAKPKQKVINKGIGKGKPIKSLPKLKK